MANATKNTEIDYFNEKLYSAVINGNTEECSEWIEKGADLNYRDSAGDTMLHKIILTSNVDSLKILTDLGADVTTTNNQEKTPRTCRSRR